MSERPVELACQQLVELVNEYLGHRLTIEERAAFDAHLETCPPCTAYLEQMRTLLTLARSLGSAETSDGMEQQLLDVFERWREKNTS
jgi:anti-sigma factor RsiW